MSKNQNGIHDFFSGRNGMDNLSRFLLCIASVMIILAGIFRLWVLLIIGIGILVYVIFRTFRLCTFRFTYSIRARFPRPDNCTSNDFSKPFPIDLFVNYVIKPSTN